MVLSKKECLLLCIKLWTWLIKNPGKSKALAPVIKNYPKKVPHNCFCCLYVKEQTSKDIPSTDACKRCPLFDLWVGGYAVTPHCPCEHFDFSPWEIWRHVYLYKEADRIKAAKQIVAYCKKLLKAMN
jgi:hypothetical protein